MIKITQEEIIKRFKKKHGNKFDYSKVKYINTITEVDIICPKHKLIKVAPRNHLRSFYGCNKCSRENSNFNILPKGIELFIKQSNKVHNNKYDYSKSIYINSFTKMIIICKKHGKFEKNPHNHINSKQGCPNCKKSNGEIKIYKILKNNNLEFYQEYIFKNQPENIKKCRFDFYIPKINLVIEYNGRQHYDKDCFFYKDDFNFTFLDRNKKDYDKEKFCKNNNINYLCIKYNENILNKLATYLEAGNSLES